ncbi:Rieske (2Fe-2S) protein [Mycolicibacter sinensis]|uniref:Rieske domain-containing protein n=1 Tax=Mycolicibacter sinensis (strain JDM601) TaxID=875328 RepID=A0A1A2E417_MYCSD|nr:Rieske 2Fe-2S domain-containing protein [Mycolicibacter sinensis]OBF98859.1 hypothetical protein A5772_13480 [Mycolicibacter sinensis]OBG00896.1 hypothetical protein A5771_17645 [Mycolicibacter sinensis]
MTPESTTGLRVASLSDLAEREPFAAKVSGVDLVLILRGNDVSALYGRCAHRGALMADGHVDGDVLVCTVHGWRYAVDTGVSPVNPSVALTKFPAWVSDDSVYVDRSTLTEFAEANSQTYDDDGYQGAWIKPADTAEEPFVTHTSPTSAGSPTQELNHCDC